MTNYREILASLRQQYKTGSYRVLQKYASYLNKKEKDPATKLDEKLAEKIKQYEKESKEEKEEKKEEKKEEEKKEEKKEVKTFGSKLEVWNGLALQTLGGGLKKDDLFENPLFKKEEKTSHQAQEERSQAAFADAIGKLNKKPSAQPKRPQYDKLIIAKEKVEALHALCEIKGSELEERYDSLREELKSIDAEEEHVIKPKLKKTRSLMRILKKKIKTQ